MIYPITTSTPAPRHHMTLPTAPQTNSTIILTPKPPPHHHHTPLDRKAAQPKPPKWSTSSH